MCKANYGLQPFFEAYPSTFFCAPCPESSSNDVFSSSLNKCTYLRGFASNKFESQVETLEDSGGLMLEALSIPSLDTLYPVATSVSQYETPLVSATLSVTIIICVCMVFWRRIFKCENVYSGFDLFAFSWVVKAGKPVNSRPTVVGVLATLSVFPLGILLSYYLWLSNVESSGLETSYVSTDKYPSASWEFNLTVFTTVGSYPDCAPLANDVSFHGFQRKDFSINTTVDSWSCRSSYFYKTDVPTNATGVRSVNFDLPFSFQELVVQLDSWSPFLRKKYTQRILVNASSNVSFLQGPAEISILAQPLSISAGNSSYTGVEFSFEQLTTSEKPISDGFIIGSTSNVQLRVSA